MSELFDSPYVIFSVTFVMLWCAAYLGDFAHRRFRLLKGDEREDFGEVLAASLTLLGLLIGFSFSMAVTRYDLRKNCEEAEANAISTEYVRADLMPASDGGRLRALLKQYLDQRILFYETRDQSALSQIAAHSAALQAEMWSITGKAAVAQPTPVLALTVAGMNDVLNAQGFTQAAWWNRIPIAAWGLMAAVAVCCNWLLGFHARRSGLLLFVISPLILSMAFFLIADIDSPRGGVIRVPPHNLIGVAQDWTASAPPP